MAGNSGAKKFWVAIGILFLALVMVVLALMGIMYMRPNTVILGFTYAQHIKSRAYTYTESTDISTTDINSIEIESERSNIFLAPLDNNTYPLTEASSSITFENKAIVVHHVMKFEGFSYANVGEPTYEANLIGNTLHIKTTEPHHFASNPNTYVTVFLPKNISFTSVKAVSKYGNITVNTVNSNASVEVQSLSLETLSTGSINVGQIGAVQDFYFKTYKGNVNFVQNSLSCRKVEFESASGSFILHNNAFTRLLTVTDSLNIKAKGKCEVLVDNIIGDLNITGVGGNYTFSKIGDTDSPSTLLATTDGMNINVKNTLYGYVSIIRESDKCTNFVKINKLVSSGTSVIHVGKGKLEIEETSGDIAVESTTGSISLRKIDTEHSSYAYSTSGSIYVGYVASSDRHNDVNVSIITDTGHIKAENISSNLNIEVKKDSANKVLDVIMTAVTQNEHLNKISARNRHVNLTYKGIGDGLLCKLFTTLPATSSTGIMQKVNNDDIDNELSIYPTYSYQYRVAYTSPIPSISNKAGRLFVTSSVLTLYQEN